MENKGTKRVQVNISLNPELNRKLDLFVEEIGLTKSGAVALCISEYFRSREIINSLKKD